jgi:tetratricopeptide (TPR) repeat protein
MQFLFPFLLVVLLWFQSFPAIAVEITVAAPSTLTTSDTETAEAASTPMQPSALDLFREINSLNEQALKAMANGDFQAAENDWTKIIERFPQNPAAWSNRGNARASQNKLEEALKDYNKAIEIAPGAIDPYLNRAAILEALGQWEDAIADCNYVLQIDPKEPVALNSRGNARAGQSNWQEALADFKQAVALDANYSFARNNYALALYQTGSQDEAIRTLRNLVRKYPKFADARAALTAALWMKGRQGEAESQWVSVVGLDSRYKDLDWLKNIRRWPPEVVAAMEKFLSLRS